MTTGRKRKPDKLKLIEGTFRPHRANPDAPGQDKDALTVPPWLPADCVKHFVTVKERLAVYRLDSTSWCEAAAMIAMRIQEIEDCNRLIAEQGRTYAILNANGEPVIKGNPAVAQKNEAMRHLQSLLAEFGLTPASISKVSAKDNKGDAKDPWAKFT